MLSRYMNSEMVVLIVEETSPFLFFFTLYL